VFFLLALLQSPLSPQAADVSPARMRETLQELCKQPRVAGSLESHHARDYVDAEFQRVGLVTHPVHYSVYAPRQIGQSLFWRPPLPDDVVISSVPFWLEMDLSEVGFTEDPASLQSQQPPMHGLTASGTAEGPIVFAGFGTEKDFSQLREDLGDELEGSIALIRYGKLYRGLKVANAEAAGCAGVLIYTDPDDDGASRGKVLPEGKWRPETGIQRGSVFNGNGDPLTPGWASTEGAQRISVEEAVGLVGIPSLPISWKNAKEFFEHGERPNAVGKQHALARIQIQQNDAPVTITNVFGVIPGMDGSGEIVLIGAHRDSWGLGAVDNGTGSTALLEIARVFGIAYTKGWKPDRTLVFCSWDGEEWGLMGSTEAVEEKRDGLRKNAVGYINLDVVASGGRFSAFATPGLADPMRVACEKSGLSAPSNLGTPGGGSDHVPFLEWAGVEVAGFGFHGGQGTYHSQLDTPYVVETFLDPDFELHAKAAKLGVHLLLHLSSKETKLHGAQEWMRRAREGAARLLPHKNQSLAWKGFFQALKEATKRTDQNPKPAKGFRFHQAFIADDFGSLLWHTEGYGSLWFPRLTGDSSEAVILETTQALQKVGLSPDVREE
jgi:N-acetylated-alpha-linked acidic dipeptidase